MSVKIAAQFTGEARTLNGLDNIADQLVAEPKEQRVLVAVYHVLRRTTEDDEGSIIIPTVKLDQLEPVLDEEDEKTVRAILARAYQKRMDAGSLDQPNLFSHAGRDEDED